jgi:hypothetical protein
MFGIGIIVPFALGFIKFNSFAFSYKGCSLTVFEFATTAFKEEEINPNCSNITLLLYFS